LEFPQLGGSTKITFSEFVFSSFLPIKVLNEKSKSGLIREIYSFFPETKTDISLLSVKRISAIKKLFHKHLFKNLSSYFGESEADAILNDFFEGFQFFLHDFLKPTENQKKSNSKTSIPERTEIKRKLWILSVGINTYEDKRVKKLDFAERDAEDIADALMGLGTYSGFDVRDPQIITGEVDQEQIISALSHLSSNVGETDRVIIFFSGHGKLIEDEYYLLTHYTKLGNYEATAINQTSIRKALEKFKKTEVMVFLDTCHAGALIGAKNVNDESDIRQAARQFDFKTSEVLIVAATKGDAEAFEDGDVGRGVFAAALLQTLETWRENPNSKTLKLWQFLEDLDYELDNLAIGKSDQKLVVEKRGTNNILFAKPD
jgi:hypothetical protein